MGDVREEMEMAIAERKADKRKNIEAEYETKLKELLEDMEKSKGESEDNTNQARRTQLKRLTQLINRKTDIERQLTSTTSELVERYDQMKQELTAALHGKMDDMTNADKILADELEVDQTVGQENIGGQAVRDVGGGKGNPNGHHAGGDTATADKKGIIREVSRKEQVKRAEELARMGRRA